MNILIYYLENQKKIIITEIKEASMFSDMANTTPDSSHKDQMSVCIRYIDSKYSL